MELDSRIKKLDARKLNDREFEALTNSYKSHRPSDDDIEILDAAIERQGIRKDDAA